MIIIFEDLNNCSVRSFAMLDDYIGFKNIGSWYQDYSSFPFLNKSWIHRGGAYSLGFATGVFAFGATYGEPDMNYTFRIVLAP